LLRNYLHEQRLEAISSALPINFSIEVIESMVPNGLIWKTEHAAQVQSQRRLANPAQTEHLDPRTAAKEIQKARLQRGTSELLFAADSTAVV
jgi:hypothetical protein